MARFTREAQRKNSRAAKRWQRIAGGFVICQFEAQREFANRAREVRRAIRAAETEVHRAIRDGFDGAEEQAEVERLRDTLHTLDTDDLFEIEREKSEVLAKAPPTRPMKRNPRTGPHHHISRKPAAFFGELPC